MRRGASMTSKFLCPLHEAPGRYESQSSLDPILEEHGFEAMHWSAVGGPNAPDEEIMEYATAHQQAPHSRPGFRKATGDSTKFQAESCRFDRSFSPERV